MRTADAAVAQFPLCAESQQMRKTLADKYQEHLAFTAKAGDTPVEWHLCSKGTYTILAILPDGRACISAAGKDLKLIKLPIMGEDA